MILNVDIWNYEHFLVLSQYQDSEKTVKLIIVFVIDFHKYKADDCDFNGGSQPIVFGKYDRDLSKFLQFLHYQDSDERKKIN